MEEKDIRQLAKQVDPAIDLFFRLGNMTELRRCILLQEYIHETWRQQEALKKRMKYLASETDAIREQIHEAVEILHGR